MCTLLTVHCSYAIRCVLCLQCKVNWLGKTVCTLLTVYSVQTMPESVYLTNTDLCPNNVRMCVLDFQCSVYWECKNLRMPLPFSAECTNIVRTYALLLSVQSVLTKCKNVCTWFSVQRIRKGKNMYTCLSVQSVLTKRKNMCICLSVQS